LEASNARSRGLTTAERRPIKSLTLQSRSRTSTILNPNPQVSIRSSRVPMKNYQKQRKMKKMKLQMKKNENLVSKFQILTPNQEIFKNWRKFSFVFIICLSFFYHVFSFSLPVAPEI
jgi:hypothetical protein